MMAYSEDHIALAAEYALGTLDAGERAQVETMMSVDKEFTAMVEAWEHKLAALNQMVGSVEPRPYVWDNIRIAVGTCRTAGAAGVAGGAAAAGCRAGRRRACRRPPRFPTLQRHPAVRTHQALAQRSRASMSAIAAALVAMIAVQVFAAGSACPTACVPSRAPRWSRSRRPLPLRRRRRNMSPCCRRTAARPAFILTVDGATRNFTVRKVGAAAEPGKSFELWLISDKLPQPRSLGVIGGDDFTARPVLASYDAGTVNAATYAVTVEQAGGSPDGKPTSAPIFTGKLIETVPPAAPAPRR